jgi:hypothetical protein
MKIKNGILAMVSILLSAGAAFASLTVIAPDYVSVQYAGDNFFTCTTAPTCNGTASPCRTSVNVLGTITTTPTYEDNACTQQRLTSQPVQPLQQKPRVIVAVRP